MVAFNKLFLKNIDTAERVGRLHTSGSKSISSKSGGENTIVGRAIVWECLPWIAWLALACFALIIIIYASGAKLRISRLTKIHADECGSVQSLSFVLVLPLVVMIVLFIVQVSQLMIGTIIVHYAAYATARAAAVWIPAQLSAGEGANCISSYYVDPNAKDQTMPSLLGPTKGGLWYVVQSGSAKYDKISQAAVMACMPICPSRDVITLSNQGQAMAENIAAAYCVSSPSSKNNAAIPRRIEHKLAYAMAHTTVEMKFFHKNSEPPLMTHYLKSDIGEFYGNEIGWQDQIAVTVRHDFALLPGPGRFLAKHIIGDDKVSDTISHQGEVYTYPLSASAVISNEGEKPLIPYIYNVY